MWIVRLALRRPYSVAVMSVLILVMGVLSLSRMIVDIFPVIDIPVVIVIWSYPGLPPQDMERRVVTIAERAYSTTVNGIERIESQSIPGIGMLKVYFHPGTEIGAAISQLNSVSNTMLRIAPPGIQPPVIVQFNASNVPVAQLTVSSKKLSEQELFDYGLNFIRLRLFTIPGLSTPAPFGGKTRQIMVDIDPTALTAKGLSPADVVTALQTSNIIIPAGTARMGTKEYNVLTNSSPSTVEQFNEIPVKVVGTVPVYLGDVAHVSDSYAEQTNIVRVNGKRATYLAILKHADASTLTVVESTRKFLPLIKSVAPEGLDLKIDFDQSVFVRAAIEGVVREAVLGSVLVSLMILAFLGSWRSMVVVCTSIPLAIFTSIIAMELVGYTINIMTLGGLALSIGMLVDDATVEVENIHRNRAQGKPLLIAILDSASQVAVPAIVATLAICVVFFPVVLLTGPAKFLFTPLAFAVVMAMLSSYLLSRTLVPTLSDMLMTGEHHGGDDASHDVAKKGRIAQMVDRFNKGRDAAFDRFRDSYSRVLEGVLSHPRLSLATAASLVLISMGLVIVVGMDFFPSVDVGLMKLHFRAPPGTRIEMTEQLVDKVENRIRELIPPEELDTINDMIGIPTFYNMAFVQTDNVAGMDAEIRISLKKDHQPSEMYRRVLRETLAREFPGSSFYFQPADIVTQVLNFGLISPIDVQIEGTDLSRMFEFARRMKDSMTRIPGLEDVHINQVLDYPALQVDVDRVRAASLGLTQQTVASSILIALASSGLTAPSYFLNPANNVNYTVAVQIPYQRVNSVDTLNAIPLTSPAAAAILQPQSLPLPTDLPSLSAQTLANVAAVYHRVTPENINHYTVQRVLNVDGTVEGSDLGSVARGIQQKIAELGKLPAGTFVTLRGQYEVMYESFKSLGLGMILAILLVYLLMVVLFQSWLDPFIIMMAVPGAIVGILWMLALTGTTINVESLMGSIMAVGIAQSNSILLVSFANDIRVEQGLSPRAAIVEAARTRLRPVLMTAIAMIIGMLPMAFAMGEGGEQNAPLGRAVVGGLIFATVTTLFLVPVFYTMLRKTLPTKHLLEERFRARSAGEIE